MKKNALLINAVLFAALFLFSVTNKTQKSDDWPVPSKYTKMKNPYADVKDSDQIGRELYAVHCKSCHGKKGLGDVSKSKELETKVPDITTSEFKAQADGDIYYKTFIGREDMPGFEKKIKDEEDRWLLVNYCKQL